MFGVAFVKAKRTEGSMQTDKPFLKSPDENAFQGIRLLHSVRRRSRSWGTVDLCQAFPAVQILEERGILQRLYAKPPLSPNIGRFHYGCFLRWQSLQTDHAIPRWDPNNSYLDEVLGFSVAAAGRESTEPLAGLEVRSLGHSGWSLLVKTVTCPGSVKTS